MTRSSRLFSLGDLFTSYARRQPHQRFWFAAPLDIAPDLATQATLRQLAALVEQAAHELREAGVGPGARVAIIKRPSPDVSLIQQAVVMVGAVAAMIWPYADSNILETLLRRLDQPWLVTDEGVRAEWLGEVPLAELTRGVLTVRPGRWQVDHHERRPTTLQLPSGAVLITHSSGTTGVPKLMAFDNAGVGAHTTIQTRVSAALNLTGPGAFCLSYFHNRMPSALATALVRRADMLLLDDADVEDCGRLLAMVRPQVVETFPNVYIEWEDLARHPAQPLANVRVFVNTFDAVHPRSVLTMLHASRRHQPIHLQAYGSTETGPLTIRPHTRRSAASEDLRCVGYPIPGLTRVRLIPRPGTDDERTGRGEIQVRAKGAALTYVGEPGKQAPGSPNNWWGTGDLGERGRYGCLHLLDRLVDETPGSASNLAQEDLLLFRLPQLREVVLVPSSNSSVPVPVVCTRADAPLDLPAWLRATDGLPDLAEPRHLSWSAVPRSSTWKVRRIELREALEAGRLDRHTISAVNEAG